MGNCMRRLPRRRRPLDDEIDGRRPLDDERDDRRPFDGEIDDSWNNG